ncbi:MAG: hypothetical protein K8S55_01135, partial [Phycisphaerae bacterium]|nr:hypothetical protein [Phycisphaerae bacterium]
TKAKKTTKSVFCFFFVLILMIRLLRGILPPVGVPPDVSQASDTLSRILPPISSLIDRHMYIHGCEVLHIAWQRIVHSAEITCLRTVQWKRKVAEGKGELGQCAKRPAQIHMESLYFSLLDQAPRFQALIGLSACPVI